MELLYDLFPWTGLVLLISGEAKQQKMPAEFLKKCCKIVAGLPAADYDTIKLAQAPALLHLSVEWNYIYGEKTLSFQDARQQQSYFF